MGTRSKFGIVAFLLLAASLVAIVLPLGSTDGVAWHEAGGATPEEASGVAVAGPATSEAGAGHDGIGQPARELASIEVAPAPRFERDAVYGVVQDEKGVALAGAAVELLELPRFRKDQETVLATAASGGDGRFRFPGLRPFTSYELRCAAEGRVPVTLSVHPGHDVRIVLSRAGWLVGQVLNMVDRTPIPGVSLSVHGPGGSAERALSAQSDARGGYRLPAPLGTVTVWSRREGAVAESHRISVEGGKPTTFDILLSVLTPRSGEVFDGESGAPVAGAVIRDQTQRAVLARSDAGGRFTLASASREAPAILVEAPGYGTSRCETKAQPAGPLRIALLKGAVIEGVVVDSAGKPLVGAAVRMVRQEPPPQPAARKPFDERVAAAKARMPKLPPGTSFVDAGSMPAWTDAEGRFRLTGLVSASGLMLVAARAWLAGYCETSSNPVELPVIGGIASVLIQMPRGAVVAGVVMADGRPARASVMVQVSTRTWRMLTNDGGEYRIADLHAGRATVEATLTAYTFVKSSAVMDLTEGVEVRKDFDIEARVATIRGAVADASGAPASRVMVRARAEQQGEGMRNFNATTAEDGAFEIHVPGSPVGGGYSVTASRGPASVTRIGVVPSGEVVALTLPAIGSVRLRVVDEEDGTPIAQLVLEWKSASRPSWTGYSHGGRRFEPGADGCFEVMLPVGIVDLRVGAPGQKYAKETIEGVPVMAQPIERRVALRRTAGLELQFVGDAASLKAHRFYLERHGTDGRMTSRSFTVNAAGRYSAQGLEPGTWRLRVTPANLVLTPSAVTLPTGPVEIRWTVSGRDPGTRPGR